MTKTEIERKLKSAGWEIIHGKRHDLAINKNGKKIAIPRHKRDIPIGTANQILKDAGLI